MKCSTRLLRFLWAALVPLLAMVLLPAPAYAMGTLELNPSDGVVRSYRAWKLLSGTVSQAQSGLVIKDVSYTPVLDAGAWEALGAPDANPQNTAEWIGREKMPDLSLKIDLAVSRSGVQPDVSEFGTSSIELEDGYWLISSDDSSPILVLVGANASVRVTEKAEAPVLIKQVKTDGDWSDFAIAGADLMPQYRLVGTLPANYDAFTSYHYEFQDRAEDGLMVDAASVKVRAVSADGAHVQDLTSFARVAVDGSALDVVFDDLRQVLPERATWRFIEVNYTSRLLPVATTGLVDVNVNTATLLYPRKPIASTLSRTSFVRTRRAVSDVRENTAHSEKQQCDVATWAIRVVKRDASNGAALEGAGFVVQNAAGLFINTDGTATPEQGSASMWRTDAQGIALIQLLSHGDYTIREVEIPAGYAAAPEAKVTIDGSHEGLKATAQGAKLGSIDAASGIIDITIEDAPLQKSFLGISMPDTSDPTSLVAIGLLALAGVLAVVLALRERNREDTRRL